MNTNEEIVERLRETMAAAAARLTPDIEPAFVYAWREISPEAEPDDAD